MSSSAEQPGPTPDPNGIDKQTSIEPSAPTSDQPVKHLIVEDNPINQRLFSNSLKKLGIASHIAENGKRAVEVYKADPEKCRFIFMDLSMPIMGGVTASREIRNYEEEKGLRPAVIVALLVSAIGPNDPNGERAKSEGGMDTAITKPVRLESLKTLLESYPI